MGPGGIATIIASCSLLIIAVALGYVVIRLGRFIDEASASLKNLTDETTPLLKESTRTVELVNGPLESFNRITKNVESVTEKVSGAADSFISKNGSALKALGLIAGAVKKRGKKK